MLLSSLVSFSKERVDSGQLTEQRRRERGRGGQGPNGSPTTSGRQPSRPRPGDTDLYLNIGAGGPAGQIAEMMDTQPFDIDDSGRMKFVRLAELSSEDHSLVRELQCAVIAPNAGSIVDAFYARLRSEPEFATILMANRARIENIKMTYRRYLLSFGVDFESADYFRERVRIGAIHASVGVPLSLYLAAGRQLQQLIISHIRALDDRRGRARRLRLQRSRHVGGDRPKRRGGARVGAVIHRFRGLDSLAGGSRRQAHWLS